MRIILKEEEDLIRVQRVNNWKKNIFWRIAGFRTRVGRVGNQGPELLCHRIYSLDLSYFSYFFYHEPAYTYIRSLTRTILHLPGNFTALYLFYRPQ